MGLVRFRPAILCISPDMRRLWSRLLVIGLASGACGGDITPATMCAANEVECNDVCADLQRDEANCGACGNGCRVGETCSAGQCETSCGV